MLEEITIVLVPGDNYTDADGEVLKKELKQRVGGSIRIYLKKVDRIETSASGKFRAVVSNVKNY